jgi:predicted dehydrogenase
MLKPTEPATDDWQSVSGLVGLAVVGMGNWGPNLLRVLGDNLEAEVRWICDLDRGRLECHQACHPRARITTRIERVLADPEVDAVVIATPMHTHYRLVAQALEAGKHVFVETPMVPSSELADELAEVAESSERILMCGYTLLHSPLVRAVRRRIADDRLGEISLDLHHFSVLLYRLGEMPTSVRAVRRDSPAKPDADAAFLTLTFASGTIATVELSWRGLKTLGPTALVGSERMAVAGDVTSPQVEAGEPLALEMRDFITAIRSGEEMAFEISLARSVVRVVEAADMSLARGGRDVPLLQEVGAPLPDWRTLAA